jgi:hypothetical protein
LQAGRLIIHIVIVEEETTAMAETLPTGKEIRSGVIMAKGTTKMAETWQTENEARSLAIMEGDQHRDLMEEGLSRPANLQNSLVNETLTPVLRKGDQTPLSTKKSSSRQGNFEFVLLTVKTRICQTGGMVPQPLGRDMPVRKMSLTRIR